MEDTTIKEKGSFSDFERVVEEAKSDRSRCGVCHERISKGVERVGIRRWSRYRNKSGNFFLSNKWYHMSCDPSSREATLAACGSVAVVTTSFSAAARNAVRDDVSEFRDKCFKDADPICPISNKKVTRETAHVHHFGPHDFKAIVDSFVKSKLLDARKLSYTSAGQFCDIELEKEFQDFHRSKAQFLLVHKNVNLSTLKKHPGLGPCRVCAKPRQLTWVFSEGVCKKCEKTSEHRSRYLSQRQSLRMYGLNLIDLQSLQCQLMKNPISSGFSPMKLYQRSDVENAAAIKYGSAEKAMQICKERKARKLLARKKVYNQARGFSMTLRRPRKMEVSDLDGLDPNLLASPGQIRFLLQLSVDAMVGITKDEASRLIEEELSKRRAERKRK